MVQTGNHVGGEQSGHTIFLKYETTGDGIVTSLKLMEVMLAKCKPMRELAAPVVLSPGAEERAGKVEARRAERP